MYFLNIQEEPESCLQITLSNKIKNFLAIIKYPISFN